MPRSKSPQDRLEAIETLLLWEDRVTNSRLRDFFDIHSVQASRDLAAYRERAPDNCEPVMSERGYVATRWMKPVLTDGSFRAYQRLVGAMGVDKSLQAGVASEVVLEDVTRTSRKVFPDLHTSIRTAQGLDVEYQSMRHPEVHKRRIFPHSLIQAGARWHVRAYCVRSSAFRDFNIGRMRSAVVVAEATPAGMADDKDWNTEATLRLRPHEALNTKQSLLVRNEFMDGTSGLAFTRRVPLLHYLIQAFGAAIDPSRQLPPAFLLQVCEPKRLPRAAMWSESEPD